jgi:hypothetical protein
VHMCPCIVVKRPNSGRRASEVITLIELPPYRGPHSPIDLVPSEIMFGCLFDAFYQMSHDKIEDMTVPVREDSRQPKKACRVLATRKILMVKYLFRCP